MKILVIGGTKFIGLTVVRQLSQMGHEVTVFHRGKTTVKLPQNVQEILGDRTHITDFKSKFAEISPQVVLDMFPYTENDALMLMKTFKGITQRIVAISSMDVYRAYGVILGREFDVIPLPITEDSPLRSSLYPYRNKSEKPLERIDDDYEKILVEKVVMSDPDLPGTIVRLPMVYGENDPLNRLFPYLQRMDENRQGIVLEESLAGWRGCYGYVENVGYAITLAVTNERASDRIYHVADTQVLSEAERITKVGEVVGWQGKVVTVPPEKLPTDWKLPVNTKQDWFIDSTRIRQELGYSEIISPEEALQRTIDWQRTHPPQEPDKFAAPWLLDYATEDAILAKLL